MRSINIKTIMIKLKMTKISIFI